MKRFYWVLFLLLIACNQIVSGDDLSNEDIQRIQELGILDKDEQIIQFYSESKNSVAGNFFTNKRLASYWIDEDDKTQNQIHSAYYPEIVSIDTVSYAGVTYSPYLLVKRKDNASFKVCFDGKIAEIRSAFNKALELWRSNKE